jgi:hypothetical protein
VTEAATAEAPPVQDDRKVLEALVVDNDDLERLETLIAEFNIFEAIGSVRHELRHSELLAFLLDPNEAHGLGDSFLRRLLQRALATSEGKVPVSPVDLDVWELDEVEVRREWSSIDILVVDSRNKLAVIIENKIDSSEHSDQLRRYWAIVGREFPDHRLLGLYLTPDRDEPSDKSYFAIDYGLVADLVERFTDTRASTIGPDVRTVLRHYGQMLRRHIVSDSEIADLCRKLYKKHRRAFDLVFAHRPDPKQGVVRDLVEKLVQERPNLVLDDCTRSYVRFAAEKWDASKAHALFQFDFSPEKVVIRLVLGPGPVETRQRLLTVAQGAPDVFKGTGKSLAAKWNQVFQRTLVDSKAFESEDAEVVDSAVREQWAAFTAKDLPAIVAALDAQQWLWE